MFGLFDFHLGRWFWVVFGVGVAIGGVGPTWAARLLGVLGLVGLPGFARVGDVGFGVDLAAVG